MASSPIRATPGETCAAAPRAKTSASVDYYVERLTSLMQNLTIDVFLDLSTAIRHGHSMVHSFGGGTAFPVHCTEMFSTQSVIFFKMRKFSGVLLLNIMKF